MTKISAEVDVDPQHGPVLRVKCGATTVAIYLADRPFQSAIVTTDKGQYGIEVTGRCDEFYEALKP